ncbi:MAG: type II toxin-antitoxin system VapC family toxin [Thermoplasmata archaeon]
MNGTTVYLDSSVLAKRYLVEGGTEAVDTLYHRAEAGEVRLAFSLWNLGEVLSAVAKAQRLDWISPDEARTAAWSLIRETLKVRNLGALRIVPVRGDLLAQAVPLLFRHGLTQPDGLQITTCKDIPAEAFVSADRKLLEAALAEGLFALHPVTDEDRIRSL